MKGGAGLPGIRRAPNKCGRQSTERGAGRIDYQLTSSARGGGVAKLMVKVRCHSHIATCHGHIVTCHGHVDHRTGTPEIQEFT